MENFKNVWFDNESAKKELKSAEKCVRSHTTAANKQVREYGRTVSGCVSAVLAAYQTDNSDQYYNDLRFIVRNFCEVTETKTSKSQIMLKHAGRISEFIGYLQPVTRTNKAGESVTKLTTCTTAKVLAYMKSTLIDELRARYDFAKAYVPESADAVADEIKAVEGVKC